MATCLDKYQFMPLQEMYVIYKSCFVLYRLSPPPPSSLVIVTVLTKPLIWGSWLLSMCRHPGCRGNRSEVVSKRRRRPLQCSRKTAVRTSTSSDGAHSGTVTRFSKLRARIPPPGGIKHTLSRSGRCVSARVSSHVEIRVRGTLEVHSCGV